MADPQFPFRPRIFDDADDGDDDGLSDVRKDSDGEKRVKSRVVHIRVDMEMWREVRAAAIRVDRKPCAWVRRAIQKELKVEEKRRKRR